MEIIGASPSKMLWCHSNRNFLNNFRINSSSNKKRIFKSHYKQDSRTNCIKTQKMPRQALHKFWTVQIFNIYASELFFLLFLCIDVLCGPQVDPELQIWPAVSSRLSTTDKICPKKLFAIQFLEKLAKIWHTFDRIPNSYRIRLCYFSPNVVSPYADSSNAIFPHGTFPRKAHFPESYVMHSDAPFFILQVVVVLILRLLTKQLNQE